jgi:hypothetical protein
MLLLCPNCEGKVDLNLHSDCPLCQEDLTGFSRIADGAAESLQLAVGALRERRYEESLDLGRESYGLLKTKEAAAVCFVSALAMGQLEDAVYWARSRRRL